MDKLNITVIQIGNNTIFVYPDGHSEWSNGTDFLPEGGSPAVIEYFSYTVLDINGVPYKIYDNGTCTFYNGTVVVPEGGLPKLLKYIQKH